MMADKSPKQVNVPASLPGMKTVKIEYQAEEDPEEKALRLKKDQLGFYVKDLSVSILAPLFITGAWLFCLWVLVSNGFSPVEKDRAWTAFMAILTGAVGVYFGKQIEK